MQTIPACMLLSKDELETENGLVTVSSVVEDRLTGRITVLGNYPNGMGFLGEYDEWESVSIISE